MSKAIIYSESNMSKRVKLSECVPLDKPFTVNFSVSNVCNLKCEYCTFTDPMIRKQKAMLSSKGIMSMDLFTHAVDDLKDSFGDIKQIVLSGSGEPLLNPDVARMVDYIKQKGLTNRVELLTNGVALTEKTSESLINSGLTYLRVSVNGLSEEDFQKYTGVKVDFEKYISQLKYFYEHRGNTKVYIKIINYMVETDEQKKLFYDIFEPICDIINIENLHMYGGNKVDYEKIVGSNILEQTKYFEKKFNSEICPVPFYYTFLDTDGNVYPCCECITDKTYKPMGNIVNESFECIWGKAKVFQKQMLDGKRNMSYCRACSSSSAWVRPEDILDNEVGSIRERYKLIKYVN